MALIAAMALFVGCPGGGEADDKEDDEINDEMDFRLIFTNTEDNDGVAVTIGKDSFSWEGAQEGQLVTPKDKTWDISGASGFKFQYRSNGNATFFIMDVDSSGNYMSIFSTDGSNDGWGAIGASDDWVEITIPFTYLKKAWGDKNTDLSKVYKIWFGGTDKFEARNWVCYK